MDKMHPGGASKDTMVLTLYRRVLALAQRITRERAKGLTLTPVNLRGIMFQTDGSYQKLDFNDLGILVDIVGLGDASGLLITFSSAFSDDLDNAITAADTPGMAFHDGRIFHKRGTNMVEEAQKHCIINGSFEMWEGGEPEFWMRKP